MSFEIDPRRAGVYVHFSSDEEAYNSLTVPGRKPAMSTYRRHLERLLKEGLLPTYKTKRIKDKEGAFHLWVSVSSPEEAAEVIEVLYEEFSNTSYSLESQVFTVDLEACVLYPEGEKRGRQLSFAAGAAKSWAMWVRTGERQEPTDGDVLVVFERTGAEECVTFLQYVKEGGQEGLLEMSQESREGLSGYRSVEPEGLAYPRRGHTMGKVVPSYGGYQVDIKGFSEDAVLWDGQPIKIRKEPD